MTVTETETRAACYSAFQKLCKRSLCLFVYVGVAECKCVSAHVCARYVCKPGDIPQLEFIFFCLLVGFKARSLFGLEFIEKARLRTHLFNMGSEDLTQVITIARQAPYWSNSLCNCLS